MPAGVVEAQKVESASGFTLRLPTPRMLAAEEELALTRAALAREPNDPKLRFRLARMLLKLDQFDEAIATLEAQGREEPRDLPLLATALLHREQGDDNQRAEALMERALALGGGPGERAAALATLGKVQNRLGREDKAKVLLEAALAEDPQEKDAYKRMFHMLLPTDKQAALKFAEETIAKGVVHARVLGSWALALTVLGRFEEARYAAGIDEFVAEMEPAPPEGWASLADFNAALADEVLRHPNLRYGRYGVASAKSWRVDDPVMRRTKLFPQLTQMVQREVEGFVARLPQSSHPVVKAKPARAVLHNWCVVTEGDGYETWHVHQNGWLSGVYYIQVQDHIVHGEGKEGCIAFGMHEGVAGAENAAGFGVRVERPHAGLMMLFPSHLFHRTYPHLGSGRRICFAFDVVPAE